jgi:hypothetical protein
MNKKIIAVGLLALLGIGGGVFYGKGKVENKVNEKVFNQIKSLEDKFVDSNGTKNGSITLKKEDINCVVTSSVECTINNLVIDNKLSTTKINQIIITNIEALKDFDQALKNAKNKQPVTIKNNISITIDGVSMIGKGDVKEMQGISFDKVSLTANVDIRNNIANVIKTSINTYGVQISKFDKKQKIPNAAINLDISPKNSNVDFSNENFGITLNTTEDLSDFTNIPANQQKIANINNLSLTVSLNKSLLAIEQSFFELFEYNGMSEDKIIALKAKIDLVNNAIANKKVFIPNTRKGFPQYTAMIGAAGLTLKNKDADLEKVLSYVIGDINKLEVILINKTLEVK